MSGLALLERIDAAPTWRRVDCASDVHLSAQDPATAAAWHAYLSAAPFDVLCILGDLFEFWIGDDALEADPALDVEIAVMQQAAAALARLTRRRPVYVMHGNRDFLLGAGFAAATGVQLLADPALLAFGQRYWLLSHGDAWCLADQAYQVFRAQVRQKRWRSAFLAQPLVDRLAQARALRQRSRAHQADLRAAGVAPADVDDEAAARALSAVGAAHLIHGHTHRAGVYPLPSGAQRLVLSDWAAGAAPPRLQVLSLARDGGYQVRSPLPAASA